MWQNKKFIVLTVLATFSVSALLLVGQGCSKGEDSGDSQTEEETQIEKIVSSQTEAENQRSEMQERMLARMNLDKVAAILGMNQQKVEDAFHQAQNELFVFGGDFPNPGEEWSPDDLPSDRIPPEGLPEGIVPPEGLTEGMTSPMMGGLPESILERMAEILNIDQQTLQNAFIQVQNTDSVQ